MKIGIVCYPTYGGSGVMATELGKVLAKKGHEIHFISYTQPVRLDGTLDGNIFFHEVRVLNYPLFEYAPYESVLTGRMVDVVKYEKLDLLHVHYAIPHAYAAVMAKYILADDGINIPVVTTLHGTDITLVGKDSTLQPAVRFSMNRSDAVTSVSQYLKEETERFFSPTTEIDVIPNFVDLERFTRTNHSHFRRAIAPEHERIIVHTSNFRGVKRVEDVIRVFQLINRQIPSKLLMLGDGPDRVKAEQMCRKLGICHDVRYLGKIEAVEEVLSIADLFILPSEKESFGLAALEAMACQVPVISSDVEGIPEVNTHGLTGYLAPVGDVDLMAHYAMDILKDEATLARFRIAALERAMEFDMYKVVAQYEEIYQKALDSVKADVC